jgi:hypothetical protein
LVPTRRAPSFAAAIRPWRPPSTFGFRPTSPHGERPSAFDSVVRENEERERAEQAQVREQFEREAKANRRLLVAEIMRAKVDFVASYQGRATTIVKGSAVLADDPVVLDYAECWEPEPIVKRRR